MAYRKRGISIQKRPGTCTYTNDSNMGSRCFSMSLNEFYIIYGNARGVIKLAQAKKHKTSNPPIEPRYHRKACPEPSRSWPSKRHIIAFTIVDVVSYMSNA